MRQALGDGSADASSDARAEAGVPPDASQAPDAGKAPDARSEGGEATPFDLLPPVTHGATKTFLSEERPEFEFVKVGTLLPADMPDLSTGTPTTWVVNPSDIEFFPNRSGESLVTTSTGLIAWLDRDMQLLGLFQIDCANTLARFSARGNTFSDNEGLLGITFDPAFTENGYFYVHVVPDRGQGIDIWRLRWKPDALQEIWDGRTLVASFPKPQIAATPAWLTAHDGGNPSFGPDGFLYVAIGDGNVGGGLGPSMNQAQSDDSFWGKIWRVDPDGILPPEMVAKGLRNPFTHVWRGDEMYIGDVGSDEAYSWEEINRLVLGETAPGVPVNFGWPHAPGPCALTPPTWYFLVPGIECSNYVDAVHGYSKSADAFFLEDPEGSVPASGAPFRSAVILGPAYAGGAYDGYLDNVLVYGDVLQNWVRGALFDRNGRLVADRHLAHADNYTVGFDVGPDGHVYMLNGYVTESSIYRLEVRQPGTLNP